MLTPNELVLTFGTSVTVRQMDTYCDRDEVNL